MQHFKGIATYINGWNGLFIRAAVMSYYLYFVHSDEESDFGRGCDPDIYWRSYFLLFSLNLDRNWTIYFLQLRLFNGSLHFYHISHTYSFYRTYLHGFQVDSQDFQKVHVWHLNFVKLGAKIFHMYDGSAFIYVSFAGRTYPLEPASFARCILK